MNTRFEKNAAEAIAILKQIAEKLKELDKRHSKAAAASREKKAA